MQDREYKERFFDALLAEAGYISDVARRLVEFARANNTAARCVYCGVELCATHDTTPGDLERVFRMRSFANRLCQSPGVIEWRNAALAQ